MAVNDAASRGQFSGKSGQSMGGSNQHSGEGRTTPGLNSQSGSVYGRNARQRGKGQRLTGWQESEALSPCATPSTANDVS